MVAANVPSYCDDCNAMQGDREFDFALMRVWMTLIAYPVEELESPGSGSK